METTDTPSYGCLTTQLQWKHTRTHTYTHPHICIHTQCDLQGSAGGFTFGKGVTGSFSGKTLIITLFNPEPSGKARSNDTHTRRRQPGAGVMGETELGPGM